MNSCKQCQKEIQRNIFCSSSCAAIYNNTRRSPRTKESREKTSIAIKEGIKNGFIQKPIPPTRPKIKHTYTRLYGRYKCHSCHTDFWKIKWNQKCCSKECRDTICSQNKCRKTHIKYWSKQDQKLVDLQSSWELTVAEWLDANDIIWSRPNKRLKWTCKDSGKIKTYLPDFYILKISYYIDVKNPIKIIKDADKLSQISNIIPLYVGNIEECKNFVAQLVGLEPT
jgi:hypothetical protein